MINSTLPPCPVCGQADAVQPITSAITGAGGAAVAPGIVQQLQPPKVGDPPQRSAFPLSNYRQSSPQTTRSFGAYLDTGLFVLWLVLCVIALLKIGDEDLGDILIIPIAVVIGLVVVGFRQYVLRNLPIPALRDYYKRDAAEDAAAEQRREAAFAQAQADYQRAQAAYARWQRLLYCARDNCVYDPQERHSIPLDQLPAYLAG